MTGGRIVHIKGFKLFVPSSKHVDVSTRIKRRSRVRIKRGGS
jgi:hypothetical protein